MVVVAEKKLSAEILKTLVGQRLIFNCSSKYHREIII